MTPELTALALCGLLQMVQFVLFAVPANLELGTGYTSSPRDRPPSRQMSTVTARLQRAMSNHFEGLILFTLATLVVTLSGQSSALTQTAAWVFLGARILLHARLCLWLAPLALGHLVSGLPLHPHNDPRRPDRIIVNPARVETERRRREDGRKIAERRQ
jgi:uncharacterized MAPEG superfamily protein